MLCRDADAAYWIGRYVERAEATARMVDVQYHAALESGRSVLRWSSLLEITGSADLYAISGYAPESDRDAIHFFAFDERNPNGIRRSWTAARENARTIREQISTEMWEALNVAYLDLRDWNVDRVLAGSPHAFFERVKNASHLFQGILNRTLSMGEARDWLDSGRFLERADQSARVLDVKYHDLLPALRPGQSQSQSSQAQTQSQQMALPIPMPALAPEVFGVGGPLDTHGWAATLRTVSALEMFRRAHPEGITPAGVVDFLVLNRQFPASVRHGVERVEGCLRRIGGNSSETPRGDAERRIGRLKADLIYAHADEIIAGKLVSGGLHEFLEDVQVRLADVGSAIARQYLQY